MRIICRCGRHIAQVDGIQSGDVDAEFHGRRAEQYRQEIIRLASLPERIFVRRDILLILWSPAESPLSPLAALLVDLRSVFAAFETKEPFAIASERFGERLIKLDKVAIWIATVGAAISGDETHRIGRQTPALAIERGQDRSE